MRALALHPTSQVPPPGLDVALHWGAAGDILRGEARGPAGKLVPRFDLAMPSAPLFPLLLAGTRSIGQRDNLVAHRWVIAVLGVLAVLAVYAMGRVAGASRLSCELAAGVIAFSPAAILFSTRLLKVVPELLLLAGFLATCCYLATGSRRSGRVVALSAIAGALLVLLGASQIAAYAHGFVLLIALRPLRTPRAAVGLLSAVVSGCLVFLALAAVVRTLRADHELFVPQGGIHARIGFQDGASGTYTSVPRLAAFPYGHTFGARLLAESETGRALSFDEADEHHFGVAVRWIVSHPWEALGSIARKARLHLSASDTAGNVYAPALRSELPWLRWMPFGWGVVWICAVWGAITLWRDGRRQLLAVLCASWACVFFANLGTFVTTRYRLPALVPLALLAGIGLASALAALRRRHTRSLWIGGGSALLVTLICWWPLPQQLRDAMSHVAQRNAARSLQASRWAAELETPVGERPASADHRPLLLWQLHRHSEVHADLQARGDELVQRPELCVVLLTHAAWLDRPGQARALMAPLEASVRTSVLEMADPLVAEWVARRDVMGALR